MHLERKILSRILVACFDKQDQHVLALCALTVSVEKDAVKIIISISRSLLPAFLVSIWQVPFTFIQKGSV